MSSGSAPPNFRADDQPNPSLFQPNLAQARTDVAYDFSIPEGAEEEEEDRAANIMIK